MAIAKFCDIFYHINMGLKFREKINPTVKEITILLGTGVAVTALFAFPALGIIAKTALDIHDEIKRKKEKREWEKYNTGRLREVLKRLHQQKIVEIKTINGQDVVALTEKGKTKYLKYKLEDIHINKPERWDGKWRLLIYDISKYKKKNQQIFRELLKTLKFLQLQKSVYLYPYPCEGEIEYLRQYYEIGEDVMLLTVEKLENEYEYKKYFGL